MRTKQDAAPRWPALALAVLLITCCICECMATAVLGVLVVQCACSLRKTRPRVRSCYLAGGSSAQDPAPAQAYATLAEALADEALGLKLFGFMGELGGLKDQLADPATKVGAQRNSHAFCDTRPHMQRSHRRSHVRAAGAAAADVVRLPSAREQADCVGSHVVPWLALLTTGCAAGAYQRCFPRGQQAV